MFSGEDGMMIPAMHNPSDRREFLRSTARCGLLALFAVTGAAGLRKHWLRAKDPECVNRGICDACSVFARCALPTAVEFRELERRG
jgi:hypothetical protein